MKSEKNICKMSESEIKLYTVILNAIKDYIISNTPNDLQELLDKINEDLINAHKRLGDLQDE